MSTVTEEILARYKKVEKEADSLGRMIEVKMLRPSQNMAIVRMADTDRNGVLMNYIVAASVQKIDGNFYPFAKSLADVGATLDALGPEGLEAASKAYIRLNGLDVENTEENEADKADAG